MRNFLTEIKEKTKKLEDINKYLKESSGKNDQMGEGNSLRLENWNNGNKENTNRGNTENGKFG